MDFLILNGLPSTVSFPKKKFMVVEHDLFGTLINRSVELERPAEFKYLLSSQFDPGKCNFLNLSKCQLLKLSFTQITHRVDSFSLTSWKLTSRL